MREAWHTATTRLEQSRDVLLGILIAQVFERGKFGRAAAQIRLVAGGAICNVETLPRHFRRGRFLLCHAQDPSHLVCVHIEKPGLRIEGTSAPFCAAVESREDDGPFLRTRDELPGAAKLLKLRQYLVMCRRRTLGEHVRREELACKRRRRRWERLCLRCNLAVQFRRRDRVFFDRKERSSSLAIENVHEPLLRRLCDRINFSRIAPYSYQARRRREI